MSRRSPDLRKASLATLKKHIARADQKIGSLQSSLTAIRQQEAASAQEHESIANHVSRIEEEICRLKKIRQKSSGFLGAIFGATEQPPDVRRAIDTFDLKLHELQRRKWEIEALPQKAKRLEDSIGHTNSWRSRLEAATERHHRKNEKLVALRAAAAANASEARVAGASVKRGLPKQPWCPYCGDDLGSDPHADHIYPLSKGGRSVPRNMVYACSSCNSKKRDLTLTAFIRKFSLDRDEIESRLDELKKDY